jgi:hypothetical protein
MTDQSFPITPPPELVEQWKRTAPHRANETEHYHYITLCAAQWGADQELEALLSWLRTIFFDDLADALLTTRRPKPPTLKEQAIAELEKVDMLWDTTEFSQDTLDSLDTIRRALEALPND